MISFIIFIQKEIFDFFLNKCGKSKNITKRKEALQTALIDEIKTIYKYQTSDANLLEYIVHRVLDRYRYHSNREHFYCNKDYIKNVIDITGMFIDTLYSTYEYITKNELLEKIYKKLEIINEDNNEIINEDI